jgi:SHS2 domain-containing protein
VSAAASASAPAGWEHFAHDADIGVMGHGATLAEAFEQAALALTAIVTDAPVATSTRVDVACRRGDPGLLLVDWLDAVIYAMAVRKMLFGRFRVEIDGADLRGTLWGEPVDVARHAPGAEPKGATLTALKVERQPDGSWSAGCVVDV